MSSLDQENLCYPHAWVGRGNCPHCSAEKKRLHEIEENRWQGMTVEQKIDELRAQIKELASHTIPGCFPWERY